MKSRVWQAAAAAALLGWAAWHARLAALEGRESPGILGPLAQLAALVEWTRFETSVRAGREHDAWIHGERALALAPEFTQGWEILIGHLGLDLASREREEDPGRRSRLLQEACELSLRGEARCAHPERLALQRAVLLLTRLETDPAIPWPGGVAGLTQDAIAALRRAAELGEPSAGALADQLAAEAGAR